MSLVICPGMHDPELTQSFLFGLRREKGKKARRREAACRQTSLLSDKAKNLLIFPAQDEPAFSAFHVLQFLGERLGSPQETSPLVFISFSAGVVGAIGAAWGWQLLGGKVLAFIAIDGWGVPLFGNFPIHRLSHDYFTHWSSSVLGSGEDSFYAEPPVEHLQLWRSPQTVEGWCLHPTVGKSQPRTRLTAAQFLTMLLERYKEIAPSP